MLRSQSFEDEEHLPVSPRAREFPSYDLERALAKIWKIGDDLHAGGRGMSPSR
jgi:hypothetical protein